MDDIKRRSFLADEQDPLAPRDRVGNQVGDGLALPGARRALHHERLSAPRRLEATSLCRIRVKDREVGLRRLNLVELSQRGNRVRAFGELLDELALRERDDGRMLRDRVLVVEEVPVHDVLLEGEEPQRGVASYRPAAGGDYLGNLVELLLDRLVLPGPSSGMSSLTSRRSFFGQGGVNHDFFVVDEEQAIGVARGFSSKLDGDEDERRGKRLVPRRVDPVEESRRDVEDSQRFVLKLGVRLLCQVVEDAADAARREVAAGDDFVGARGSGRLRGTDYELVDDGGGLRLHLVNRVFVLLGREVEVPRRTAGRVSEQRLEIGRLDLDRARLRRSILDQSVPIGKIDQPAAPILNPVAHQLLIAGSHFV